ncbi:hypothetical protein ACI5AD_001202 [Cronobacter sakazakii]|uniref:hypothetical protein n=1 Tax=Cronobacter sakazakii TaxID=28141 RepID=UPI000DA152FF|nr:hypothetical protein [Cronobacter sakazakii]EJK9928084.1 hypothetical protein [Cronobacter sakazakii]EKM7175912.1 hypothetical protein [Cronobacter sakazakii]ELY4057138.1 hypothetical protein [Cronobacter sakazakii]ELY6156312.1 hypothetical protein [Cronobacter sakazakii]ELY6391725.1 hypothetical protein [Cronobacter sakazakii]
MERYQNRGGDSGIVGYEIRDDSIIVQFRDNSIYLYNLIRPGQVTVDHMKILAKAGQGLNSYINRTVRKNFYQKLQ